MSTIAEDQTTQNKVTECQCREQIADILARLEKLEREALTLKRLEGPSITERIMDSLSR